MPTTTRVVPEFLSTMEPEELLRTRQAMINLAAARHAQYPQYDGHWEDWLLVVITHDITLKGGRGLDRFQVTIGQRRQPTPDLPNWHWTVYSPQRNSNVGALGLADVQVVTAR